MNTARRLIAALVLTLFVTISGLAGQTSTPPCAPGQIDTPPCANAQAPTDGEILTPPAASDEAYLTEIAASVMFSIMSLF
jgi:hypothetical protein